MKKYLLGVVLILVMFFAFSTGARASTLSNILAQINSLQEQISNLKTQLLANAGTGENGSGNEWVTTGLSSNLSYTSASISGNFGAYYIDNAPLATKFKYSTNASLANSQTTPIVYIEGPGGGSTQSIVGLAYNTTYYYRFEVVPPAGSGYASLNGLIKNFKTLPRDGICGSANNQGFEFAPAQNLCSGGAPSGVIGVTQWNWSCSGVMGSTVKSNCAAKKIVDFSPAIVQPGQPQPVINYTVPSGITKISSVEVWGPGGGGGGSAFCSNNSGSSSCVGDGGGGGGGGEYKKLSNLNVTPGEIFSMKIYKGGTGGTAINKENSGSGGFGFRSENTIVIIKGVTNIAEAGNGGRPGTPGAAGGYGYSSNPPAGANGTVGAQCVGGNGGKGGGIGGAQGGAGGINNSSMGMNNGQNGSDGYSGSGGGGGGGNGGSFNCLSGAGLHGNGGKGGDGRVLITYPFIPATAIVGGGVIKTN